MNAVLEFTKIIRSYANNPPVLKGVSFSMNEGDVVGLLGRNGAGKTTLIRIAMGMLYPDSGSVKVFGLSPTVEPVAVKKRIGYVSEDQILPPFSTVSDLIGLHRYLYPEWDREMERDLIARFKLPAGKKIRHLSKGQARQAALLCAICHRPELLILDEPAGGLDAVARREFLETSIRLLNREGTTILFSSHQMADVERLGGRVVILDDGRVRLDRDLDRLCESVCVAHIPKTTVPDAGAIGKLPGCLGIRSAGDFWHAVMEETAETAQERMDSLFGSDGIRCARAPLEELFIIMVGEMTGADRKNLRN